MMTIQNPNRDVNTNLVNRSAATETRKPWVTPVVSESPVNDLTALTGGGQGQDAEQYS